MTIEDAITTLGEWPRNRNVPRLLSEGIQAAKGQHKAQLQQMAEILFAESLTQADIDLVDQYFG